MHILLEHDNQLSLFVYPIMIEIYVMYLAMLLINEVLFKLKGKSIYAHNLAFVQARDGITEC